MAILQKSLVSGSLFIGTGSAALYGSVGSNEFFISAPKYSGSGFVFTGSKKAGSTVGGISAGLDLSNKDIKEILDDMLFYTAPKVTHARYMWGLVLTEGVRYTYASQYLLYGTKMGGLLGDSIMGVDVTVTGGLNVKSYIISTSVGDIELSALNELYPGSHTYDINEILSPLYVLPYVLPVGSHKPTVTYTNSKLVGKTFNGGTTMYIRNYVFAYISPLDYSTASQQHIQGDFLEITIYDPTSITKTLAQTSKYTSGIVFKGGDGSTHHLYYAIPLSWAEISLSDTTKLSGGAIGTSLIEDTTVSHRSFVNPLTTTQYRIYKIGDPATSGLNRTFLVISS